MTAELERIDAHRAAERHRILKDVIAKMVGDEAIGVLNEHMGGRRNALAEVASALMVKPCPSEHVLEAVTEAVREVPHPLHSTKGAVTAWALARTWRVLNLLGAED